MSSMGNMLRPPRMSFILNALLILASHTRPNDASRRTTRFGSSILAELRRLAIREPEADRAS